MVLCTLPSLVAKTCICTFLSILDSTCVQPNCHDWELKQRKINYAQHDVLKNTREPPFTDKRYFFLTKCLAVHGFFYYYFYFMNTCTSIGLVMSDVVDLVLDRLRFTHGHLNL